MEKVLVKCPNCEADLISGQLFCANCGAKQELKMRSEEEVAEMLKRINEALKPKPGGANGKDVIGNLMISMVLSMVADSCLKWVMGLTDDQKLLDMFKSVTKGRDTKPGL